jgi:uncharacterized protein
MTAYLRRGDSVIFHVRLTPKGGRDAVEGWASASDGKSHLKARVRAAPEDGKANAALIALLAKELGVAKSALAIASGDKARLKTIAATGDTSALAARLEMFGEA